MSTDPATLADLRAAVLALLEGGREHVWGNKEENGRVFHAGGAFRYETYDSLVLGRAEPLERRTFRDADAVLGYLAPRPETEEGWRAVLRGLRPEPHPCSPGAGRALDGIEVDGLAFAGALDDGTRWSARAEGVEERHWGMSWWPFVRFVVEAAPPDLGGPGPFQWRVPAPDQAAWRAEGVEALREAVEKRLVERLGVARLLDFSAPQPLPGGGVWHARHADR